jgi:hypothetical protein
MATMSAKTEFAPLPPITDEVAAVPPAPIVIPTVVGK